MSYFDPAAAAVVDGEGAPFTPSPQTASMPMGASPPVMSPNRGLPYPSAPAAAPPQGAPGPVMSMEDVARFASPPVQPTPQIASYAPPQPAASTPSYAEWLKSMYVPQGPPLPDASTLKKNAEAVKSKKASGKKADEMGKKIDRQAMANEYNKANAIKQPNPMSPQQQALKQQAASMQFQQFMQQLAAESRAAQVEPIVNNDQEQALFQEMLNMYARK